MVVWKYCFFFSFLSQFWKTLVNEMKGEVAVTVTAWYVVLRYLLCTTTTAHKEP